jgi:hypothetical protein
MFSVKIDVIHSILELHLGGALTENQLADFAQELKSVFASMPEPPLGVLFERKSARPSNQHITQLLVKVCELIQHSGARRFADVGTAEIASFTYDDRCRRFDSEEEGRRWLFQFSSPPPRPTNA